MYPAAIPSQSRQALSAGYRTMSSSTTTSNKRKRSCSDDFIDDGGTEGPAAVEMLGDDGRKKTCAACQTDIIPCQHPGSIFFQLRGQCTHVLCASCLSLAHCRRAWNSCLTCPVENCGNASVRKYYGYTAVEVDGTPAAAALNRTEYEIHVPLTLSHIDDELVATCLSFLHLKDILRASMSCKAIRHSALITRYEPILEIGMDTCYQKNVRAFNKFWNLANVVPGILDLSIGPRPAGHMSAVNAHVQLAKENSWRGLARVKPGKDPPFADEEAHPNSVNFNDSIVKFPHLRKLEIIALSLNGAYPGIYRLANLECLSIQRPSRFFTMDLNDLSSLRHLRILKLSGAPTIGGSLKSLNAFASQLEELELVHCQSIEGNLLDLAHFSSLKKLEISSWQPHGEIRGDIGIIGAADFPALEYLALDSEVIIGSWLTSIPQGQEIMEGLCRLFKQPRRLKAYAQTQHTITELLERPHNLHSMCIDTLAILSLEPDYPQVDRYDPPYQLKLINYRDKYGWRWGSKNSDNCDIVWLDEAPKMREEGYWHTLNENSIYRGLTRPPNRDEYLQILKKQGVRDAERLINEEVEWGIA